MGNCIKRPHRSRGIRGRRQPTITIDSTNEEPYILIRGHTSSGAANLLSRQRSRGDHSDQPQYVYHKLTEAEIDQHVLQTLKILRTSAENDTDLILKMRDFRFWANSETGWNMVLGSLVRTIPIDEPLGPSAITLFIDHCPLPTKDAVSNFIKELQLSTENRTKNPTRYRNVCAVLGHLAESLSAPFSRLILTDEVLEYLLNPLVPEKCINDAASTNALFSLIALEKIALIKENKEKILSSDVRTRIQDLEPLYMSQDYKKRQVGFLAQWLLDNVFIIEGRPYAYENVDVMNVNVMLNANDVSEYLKISPDGLEARSDAPSFESVRCTYSVDKGVWFYEVTVITSGVMQIGWATKRSKFLNHDGFGIGDDEFSYAYDGCRQLCWYQAQSHEHSHQSWKEGDTLGLLLDIDNYEVIFYLNGNPLPPNKNLFNRAKSGFFAAASFMSFQQCRFNFGSEPFKFPPKDKNFTTFNDVAILIDSEKVILPRHKKMESLNRESIREDSCTICFDERANTILEPCGHTGICESCGLQIQQCHLCRKPITGRKTVPI